MIHDRTLPRLVPFSVQEFRVLEKVAVGQLIGADPARIGSNNRLGRLSGGQTT